MKELFEFIGKLEESKRDLEAEIGRCESSKDYGRLVILKSRYLAECAKSDFLSSVVKYSEIKRSKLN